MNGRVISGAGARLRVAVPLLALLALGMGSGEEAGASAATLNGAGSTLVAPLVAAWNTAYSARTGTSINYLALGSTYGVGAITQRSVDFGATDAPLTPSQFAAANSVVQIPWALTATVISYQIAGVTGGLKLNASVLTGIYLGTIQSWDDPSITQLNPKLTLPHEQIKPFYRSDGSGDTFAFTSFLTKTSPQWKAKVGAGTQVVFPVGQGADGNSAVASAIQGTPGSIGYLSVAYALSGHLPTAAILNQAGRYATPGIRAISAAAATVQHVPPGNAISLVDPPANAPIAYPISTFTYVIAPTQTPNAAALRQFIFYAITTGQALGAKLGFAPIPHVVLVADEKTLTKIQ